MKPIVFVNSGQEASPTQNQGTFPNNSSTYGHGYGNEWIVRLPFILFLSKKETKQRGKKGHRNETNVGCYNYIS